jgi:hypothetical protein
MARFNLLSGKPYLIVEFAERSASHGVLAEEFEGLGAQGFGH